MINSRGTKNSEIIDGLSIEDDALFGNDASLMKDTASPGNDASLMKDTASPSNDASLMNDTASPGNDASSMKDTASPSNDPPSSNGKGLPLNPATSDNNENGLPLNNNAQPDYDKESVLDFDKAAERLINIAINTPLQLNANLSRRYHCNVYLKREDLQVVRSYKLRGAYNLMSSLAPELLKKGVVCASAGNHAQGFAFSCKKLNVKGVVFMPIITPKQKVNQTKMFGEDFIEIRLVGDTFDDCAIAAKKYTEEQQLTFIHPFDHYRIIEGQGTVAKEILESLNEQDIEADYVFVPVGGGGLSAGVGSYFKQHSPATKIIGIEPKGAPSMVEAFKVNQPVTLTSIERFVDGASVKRVGDLTFSICKEVLDDMQVVPEGKVCTTILKLYNEEAIVVEPAGALTITALDDFASAIKGKTIVCIVSGSNNDIDRMQEIKERSLQYEGLKHYFLISFAQRPGALKEFVNDILGPGDDITRFEYMKKTNKENGPALVGIELQSRLDYDILIENMKTRSLQFTELSSDDSLLSYAL